MKNTAQEVQDPEKENCARAAEVSGRVREFLGWVQSTWEQVKRVKKATTIHGIFRDLGSQLEMG